MESRPEPKNPRQFRAYAGLTDFTVTPWTSSLKSPLKSYSPIGKAGRDRHRTNERVSRASSAWMTESARNGSGRPWGTWVGEPGSDRGNLGQTGGNLGQTVDSGFRLLAPYPLPEVISRGPIINGRRYFRHCDAVATTDSVHTQPSRQKGRPEKGRHQRPKRIPQYHWGEISYRA